MNEDYAILTDFLLCDKRVKMEIIDHNSYWRCLLFNVMLIYLIGFFNDGFVNACTLK